MVINKALRTPHCSGGGRGYGKMRHNFTATAAAPPRQKNFTATAAVCGVLYTSCGNYTGVVLHICG